MLMVLICAVFLATGQSLFCRMYSAERKGEGAMAYTTVYTLFVGFCTFALNKFSYHPSWLTLIMGTANGIMLIFYNIGMVQAANLGSFAFQMLCMLAGGIALPVFYDVLFLGTSLSGWQIFAVFLMLASFVVMNIEGVKGKKSGKYLFWVAVLFCTNGMYNTLMGAQQKALQYAERNEMIMTTYIATLLLTTLPQLFLRRKRFIAEMKMPKKALLYVCLAAFCCTTSSNLGLLSLTEVTMTTMNVVLNGGVLVLSGIAAFLLFKEKLTINKIIGFAMAFASIIILSI